MYICISFFKNYEYLQQMRLKKIIIFLPIGVLLGFIVGLVISLNEILAHEYFQYKMLRLIIFSFKKNLNKWTILAIIIIISLLIIWLIVLFITKLVRKLYLSNKKKFILEKKIN